MKLEDIRPNLRITLEIEHENPSYRSLRGIVVKVEQKNDSFTMITDFGEVMNISEEEVLNCSGTNFPKIVSDVLQELRNEYEEVYTLEDEIKERKENIEAIHNHLTDAVFLSRFNIHGAKNRLMHSIPKERLNFVSKDTKYEIVFESNKNKEIEMHVTVSNQIDYPQLDENRDIERIMRAHGPDIDKQLKDSFPTHKLLRVTDKGVVHEYESYYNVRKTYCLRFDINRDNFLEFRETAIKGIELLSR